MTQRKWYTLDGFLARVFVAIAKAFAPTVGVADITTQITALSILCYGAVDIFGVKGTIKLVKKLSRRKHGNTSTNKQAQGPLPRV